MYKKFSFNGQELEQGDVVAMVAESFPFEFQAAVVDYNKKTDTLQVMSTQLGIRQHNGLFPSDDVRVIRVTQKYDKGIPIQARANLKRGQRCIVEGKWYAAVTAAFDGVVTGSVVGTPNVADGTVVIGDSSWWKAA